ncbi:uncharacterized protein LOC114534203 isoform X2 [Dendronephthya gigantea]|uniref:uncharacterized protein LOC114534203 isoform X1 n=1 Tax=Dendronephthya gigantea TaxID=151771 RepID=UPI0010690615|nr:uncharacterized protein LOC114534203 isoform X1 [Dendronephthya gigantea]XP_028411561.1 uncharacterized protein LOC114534203 isoform X2 [Dendronephthya gigantea]
MPSHRCPYPDCEYETADVEDALAAVLLTVHSNGSHNNNQATTTISKGEKVKRPTISRSGTSEDWSYFLSRWKDYVDATKITGQDKVLQLLECCEEQLRKDLTRNAGGSIASKPIDEVLQAIKKLAVRGENPMVARVQLHNMRQDHDEPIRNFCARARGQASTCNFSIPCPNCETNVNYTDNVLSDVITRGLADNEIQLDLLADKKQDKTLEEIVQFVERKEIGKRSADQLLQKQGAEATRSQYKRGKRADETLDKGKNKAPETATPCNYCGTSGHGQNAPPRVRRNTCPAYGHTCEICNRPNHFQHVCRSKDKPKLHSPRKGNANSAENALFDNLCSTQTDEKQTPKTTNNAMLDHHLYSNIANKWARKASRTQPFITVQATLHPDDYHSLGLKPIFQSPRSKMVTGMADTGCQSCLASMPIIRRFGLREKDLIPVNTKMHAANGKDIRIIGATFLRFTDVKDPGKSPETRQMVYITHDTDKLYLSREACEQLGMITKSFPTIGENTSTSPTTMPTTTAATSDQPNAAAQFAVNRQPNRTNYHSQPQVTTTQQFLKDWSVHHRLSSVAFPHSNCRAEVGVKTMKRILTNNTNHDGTVDTDSLQHAVLQYRNCPDPNTGLSPAQCVFGRPIRDLIPIPPAATSHTQRGKIH